jgi:hypothetical protein
MSSEKNVITPNAWRAVMLWAIVLIILYTLVGYAAVRKLADYKAESARARLWWLDTTETDNTTSPAGPTPVEVGIYVNRISDVSVRELGWTADLEVWFRWKDPALNPGETFWLSNGEIETREKIETIVNGTERYERYRVKARLAKQFDMTRFPFVDEALIIHLEDNTRGAQTIRLIADRKNSGVSPTAIVSGILEVTEVLTGVRLHSVGSTLGKPADPTERPDYRSQFVFAMLLKPPGVRLYFKLFNVLFFSVVIAFLAFFVKPIHVDPRFGLGTGAVFAVIGNMIAITSEMPHSNQVTLSDMTTAVALGSIVLSLTQSVISLYLYDSLGLERLSAVFDKVSFAVFATGYIALSIVLPVAARGEF